AVERVLLAGASGDGASGALRQPPFYAARSADIFGPAVMDRRLEILRQERRAPRPAPAATGCVLTEFGLGRRECLRIGHQIDEAAGDGAGGGLDGWVDRRGEPSKRVPPPGRVLVL